MQSIKKNNFLSFQPADFILFIYLKGSFAPFMHKYKWRGMHLAIFLGNEWHQIINN
jgi:hypothetical protein